ncbi:Pentatricopeptide repeat-containing protein At1g02150 [Linum perenne]
MLLQPSLHYSKLSIPSTVSHSKLSISPWISSNFIPRGRGLLEYRTLPITCSISQIHSYGTVDFEKRPPINWIGVYKQISLMENPELGAGSVLFKCQKEGKKLSKWELCRIVKELRKYRHFKQALEVYEWMGNEGATYGLSASDAAIKMDLIAKVHGVSAAEEYLQKVSAFKDKRIHCALLNVYAKHKNKEKAESLFEEMRGNKYASHALAYNAMMTMYMNLKEYAKVDQLIFEMTKKNIQLDLYSYNIWLSCRGYEGSIEKMEQAFKQMKLDKNVTPNWTTYSTLATLYIQLGLNDKAEDCLKMVERRITGRDKMPYHYLLSLYGKVGNKEEVMRVWETYKSSFPKLPNLGYHAVMSSLVRLGDVQTAENLYDEWMQIKASYDPRIANLLMASYAKEGKFDKLESLFQDISDAKATPNSSSWEILAEGHIGEKRIPEALSCLKKAVGMDTVKRWRPRAEVISSFFKLCEEEGDLASKKVLEGLFRESGFLKDKTYASLIGLSSMSD